MSSWVTRLFEPTKSKRPVRPTKRKAQPRHVEHPYRAVTIYSNSNCCAAAKQLEGKKFLSNHAPVLPLGGCTNKDQCACRYKHYADRREDIRRDTDFGLPNRNAGRTEERRMRRERRHNKAGA